MAGVHEKLASNGLGRCFATGGDRDGRVPVVTISSGVSQPRAAAIVWDIVEEHFSEASFLWKQRERALVAPDFLLGDLWEVYEQRLLAHVDGLVIAGRPAADRLLAPALAEEDPAVAAVAALALLGAEEGDFRDAVLLQAAGDTEAREEICRALGLVRRADLDGALLARFGSLSPAAQACWLELLDLRRVEIGSLFPALRLEHRGLLTAALRASRWRASPLLPGWVQSHLADGDARVRTAALETGLWLGLRAAWTRCPLSLEAGGDETRCALLALASSGEPQSLERVLQCLKSPSLRGEALWALGFSGRAAAVPALLEWLEGEDGAVATESLALITGLPLEPPFVIEDAAARDRLDDALGEEAPLRGLPAPLSLGAVVVPEAIRQWWRERCSADSPLERSFQGQPWNSEILVSGMERLPLRRRVGFAWQFAWRSRGVCAVEPRAWSWLQREQWAALRTVQPWRVQASFTELMTA